MLLCMRNADKNHQSKDAARKVKVAELYIAKLSRQVA